MDISQFGPVALNNLSDRKLLKEYRFPQKFRTNFKKITPELSKKFHTNIEKIMSVYGDN